MCNSPFAPSGSNYLNFKLPVESGTSTVTRDGLVDRWEPWWESVRERFPPLTTLGLKVENGPEHPRRRTQLLQRLVACVQPSQVPVRRASAPPSSRTSNPSARCWGILEHQWHGAWLEALDARASVPPRCPGKGRIPW